MEQVDPIPTSGGLKSGGRSWLQRSPLDDQWVLAPHQASQSRVPVPGREDLIILGCENQQRLWLREMEDGWSLRHYS